MNNRKRRYIDLEKKYTQNIHMYFNDIAGSIYIYQIR